MRKSVSAFLSRVALAVSVTLFTTLQALAVENDYPTEARADYVYGCMTANGVSRDMLRRCSCSIDVIASILSYDDYVQAETVLSVVQAGGERVAALRSPSIRLNVSELRRAQAEAEVRCF